MIGFNSKKCCRQKTSDNFFSNSTSFPQKNIFSRFRWGRRLNSKKNYRLFFVRKVFWNQKQSSELKKKIRNGGATAKKNKFWVLKMSARVFNISEIFSVKVSMIPTKKALAKPFFIIFQFCFLSLIAKDLADKKDVIIFFRIKPPSPLKLTKHVFLWEGGWIRKKIIRYFLSARFFPIRNRHQNSKTLKNGGDRAFFVGNLDTSSQKRTKKAVTPPFLDFL